MKQLFYLLPAALIISCSSQKGSGLPASLDPVYIEQATHFARSQFESCRSGKYIPITKAIAEPSLVRSLTVEEMKTACAEINQKYGELVELKIAQTLVYKKTYIYRFKAKYAKAEKYSEIRVYANMENKFNGLIFKPVWLEKYTKFNPGK